VTGTRTRTVDRATPKAGAAGPAAGPENLVDVDDLLDAAVAQLGGARRDGQQAMARAVAEALTGEQQHLLVQAGTGTGKSLGYLVPAVAHAVRRGERVVVSTATLALQRQVRHWDLPLVARALGPRLDREPTVSLLKGWSNYVCRHKLEGGYPAEEPDALFTLPDQTSTGGGVARAAREAPGPLGAQVLRLRAWAEETSTGDRDDLVPGVSDRAWRAVSVTALECLGAACPMRSECLPLAAREAAAVADVVVTNHAMLGIAAGGSTGVLPEHDVLVVDEAHELVDRVTAQATQDLSVGTIEIASRLARRQGGVPTPDLDDAGVALAAVLDELPGGRLPGGLPPAVRTAVAAVASAARAALGALRPERASAGTTAGTSSTREAGGGQAGLKVATAAMLALFEVAERMSAQDPGRDVLWCERPQTPERVGDVRLRVAPLDVSGLIAGHLFEGRTAVLTSATLTLAGGFGPIAASLGLGPTSASATSPTAPSAGTTPANAGEGDRWRGLDVGSPFDYRRQGILYVARALPPPGRDGASPEQVEEMVELVTAAGGGTLGLFSSRRAAVSAAEAVRKRVSVPVLCQGDDQLPTLVRTFAEEEDACLFGTLSLWQGVDVPGRTCRLVLIDRIPFPRPDDPVRSARSAAVDAAGGSGFMAVSASHAALLLAQGAGRLIRSTTDRGVVAVLDPRLVTARYGEFLVRSLPPMWRTTDRAVARDALRRLRASG
jgi:ATP-dependent DNA helicase DinG